MLVKELIDNSLDACEQAGVAPDIGVCASDTALTVSGNGPGIDREVITRILDFSTRTSDKAAYVSPTRGAHGNALKTVLAIPYVLNEGRPARVEIESRGLRHTIVVSTDDIGRRPQIDHSAAIVVKTEGTSIRVVRDSASSQEEPGDAQFLQNLILDYSLFNPHATLRLHQDGQGNRFAASGDGFRKWLPSDPTSVHWYNRERFENLVASCIAAERTGSRQRTVREFISDFRGLSGTAKQKQVIAQAGLDRAYLHDLVLSSGQLDRRALQRLLDVAQRASAPVKPEALGVLGEDHFRERMSHSPSGNSFRYKRLHGFSENLPFVVECAFAVTDDPVLLGRHIGLNWSVPLSNPIQENQFDLADGSTAWGLPALLARNRIDLDSDPVCLVLHLICPRFHFLDRGKGRVDL